jgi:hypothetical protein
LVAKLEGYIQSAHTDSEFWPVPEKR